MNCKGEDDIKEYLGWYLGNLKMNKVLFFLGGVIVWEIRWDVYDKFIEKFVKL